MSRYVIDLKDLVVFLARRGSRRLNPEQEANEFVRLHGAHATKTEHVHAQHYHVWQLNESGQNVCAECGVLR